MSNVSNGKTYISTLLTKLKLKHVFLRESVILTLEWLTLLLIFNIFFIIMEKKTEHWNEIFICIAFVMVTELTRDIDVKIKISFFTISFELFVCILIAMSSSSFNKSVCQDQWITLIIHQCPRSFIDIFWKWPIHVSLFSINTYSWALTRK